MRILVAIAFIMLLGYVLRGQTSLEEINLRNGPYGVGFSHYTAVDSTRLYTIENNFDNKYIHRPIPISLWYPTHSASSIKTQMTVLDYLEILKEEEESKNLPNELLLDWFPDLSDTPQNRARLSEKVNARSNADFSEGKFPLIVYAPGNQKSSIENFALFEYLASNGFVVLSSPSRGTHTKWLEGGTTKDMETQSRDVEFLLKEMYKYKTIDTDNIALMGFSFGGLSNAITVMKNKNIRALVSLDGAERYNYPVLENSPYFNLERFTLPYIHFAQKEIPEEVLITDNIPAALNREFQLYDSLNYSNAYSYRFHDLTHSYFGTIGVLFSYRDKRQDKSDAKIMASYKLLAQHTLQFLDATLKNDGNAKEFIENSPAENGFSENLVSKKMKKAGTPAFDYKDFQNVALDQDYQDLIPLYERTIANYPTLKLEQGMLNNLGLRLSFNAGKMEQGINVFLLAVHLYPKSANLYDSLALAYFYNNDKKNAILNYRKSLVLNPNNQGAIDKLKQLEN